MQTIIGEYLVQIVTDNERLIAANAEIPVKVNVINICNKQTTQTNHTVLVIAVPTMLELV